MGIPGLPQLGSNPFLAQSGAAGNNPFAAQGAGGAQNPIFGGAGLQQQQQSDPLAQLGLQSMSPDTQMLFASLQTMMVGLMAMIATTLAGILSGAISGTAPPGSNATATPGTDGVNNPGTNGATGPGGAGETAPGQGVTRLSDDQDERIAQLVSEAKRVFPNDPVRQKLAVTQALLESGVSSISSLAQEHNNLFGIKGEGTAGSVNVATKEQGANGLFDTRDDFAKNTTVAESFEQYRDLIGRERYAAVLTAGSFEEAAQAVKDAGYATDNSYVSKLIDVYNSHVARHF